jgi:hypothetical protein
MPDINWGGDSSTAPFSSRLDEANGDLILAEDNSGGTVLLEYDGTTWQYRGPVEVNGEDISGVGTLTATGVTVSGTVDASSVTADEVNKTYYAAPGEIQSAINIAESAQSNPHPYMVKLIPDKDYAPTSEIDLKNYGILDFNGARVKYSSDPGHDLFFLDNHTRLRNAFIDLSGVATSSINVFRVNTTDATVGKYATGEGRGSYFELDAYIHGGATAVTGLYLHDEADAGITIGCKANLKTQRVGIGIKTETATSSGYVNSGRYQVSLNNPTVGIQTVNGPGGIFVDGTIQAASRTDHYIENQSTSAGPKFSGRLWDPANLSSSSLVGPDITAMLKQFDIEAVWDAADQSSGQELVSLAFDGFEIYGTSPQTVNGHETRQQTTTGVSTTASTIYSPGGGGTHTLQVRGRDGSDQFTDTVRYIGFGSADVDNGATRNAPASRTYAVNGNDLDLTMASGTYEIEVNALRVPF